LALDQIDGQTRPGDIAEKEFGERAGTLTGD
jgi:hypothetical protein